MNNISKPEVGSFYDLIIKLRQNNQIPKEWKTKDIKPFLLDCSFAENTIASYPCNCSISLDGKTKGDFIKNGQVPKFYRIKEGTFMLISEFVRSLINLSPGGIINNHELQEVFKCSNTGGMRRSRKTNSLVVVSDHTRGTYEDKWIDGKLHYTGMGISGNQSISFNQNRTLAESNINRVEIHLFEVFYAGQYLYHGKVKLSGEPYETKQPDINGNLRNVWIFPLALLDSKEPASIPADMLKVYQERKEKKARELSDQELDNRIKAKNGKAAKRRVVSNQYQGDPEIKEKAKRLAKGKCNLCCQDAPFRDKNDKPYLDGHHVIWLSREGPDTLSNVVALCPNCHKRMHVLDLESDINKLKEFAKKR